MFGITATYEALLLLQTHGPIEDGAVSQNLVRSISKALPRFAVLFSLVWPYSGFLWVAGYAGGSLVYQTTANMVAYPQNRNGQFLGDDSWRVKTFRMPGKVDNCSSSQQQDRSGVDAPDKAYPLGFFTNIRITCSPCQVMGHNTCTGIRFSRLGVLHCTGTLTAHWIVHAAVGECTSHGNKILCVCKTEGDHRVKHLRLDMWLTKWNNSPRGFVSQKGWVL